MIGLNEVNRRVARGLGRQITELNRGEYERAK
jgi:hypothetical protein